MPPMATSSAKRKWSDVFDEVEVYDKQSIMDLSTSKLRYVNPPRPPRRRTEVSLLRNVLIANTVKHLSSDMKADNQMEFNTEDLSIDPGHFEGLPPLSELLNDIMLDPQPNDPVSSFTWAASDCTSYSSPTPLEQGFSSYAQGAEIAEATEKVAYDLLPSTVEMGADSLEKSHLWSMQNSPHGNGFSWEFSGRSDQLSSWDSANESSMLDCLLSSASLQQPSNDSLDILMPERTFQPTHGPLPSISSLFEFSRRSSSLWESSSSSTSCTPSFCDIPSSSPPSLLPGVNTIMTDDLLNNANLSESELELLAMTFSSKLPVSFEELVMTLPQTSLLQQASPPSHTFCMPSSVQSTAGVYSDTHNSSSNQCASFFCKDQPAPSIDDNSMVRVLVNL